MSVRLGEPAPRRAGRLGLASCLVAALLAVAPASAVAVSGIRVTESEGGPTIAVFKSLQCRVGAKGFTATGKAGAWNLTVRIYSFAGFHRYTVDYGSEGNADIFVTRGNTTFSNVVKPNTGSTVRLTLGGAVGFPGGRGTLGIGFPLAYRALQLEQQASVVGRASCAYPGRRR